MKLRWQKRRTGRKVKPWKRSNILPSKTQKLKVLRKRSTKYKAKWGYCEHLKGFSLPLDLILRQQNIIQGEKTRFWSLWIWKSVKTFATENLRRIKLLSTVIYTVSKRIIHNTTQFPHYVGTINTNLRDGGGRAVCDCSSLLKTSAHHFQFHVGPLTL